MSTMHGHAVVYSVGLIPEEVRVFRTLHAARTAAGNDPENRVLPVSGNGHWAVVESENLIPISVSLWADEIEARDILRKEFEFHRGSSSTVIEVEDDYLAVGNDYAQEFRVMEVG